MSITAKALAVFRNVWPRRVPILPVRKARDLMLIRATVYRDRYVFDAGGTNISQPTLYVSSYDALGNFPPLKDWYHTTRAIGWDNHCPLTEALATVAEYPEKEPTQVELNLTRAQYSKLSNLCANQAKRRARLFNL